MCQFDKAKALIERFDPDAQKFFSSPQFAPGGPGLQPGQHSSQLATPVPTTHCMQHPGTVLNVLTPKHRCNACGTMLVAPWLCVCQPDACHTKAALWTAGTRPVKQRGPPGSAAAAGGGSGPGRPGPAAGLMMAAPPMVAGAAASAVAGAGRALMPLLDKLAAGLIADNPVLVEDLRWVGGRQEGGRVWEGSTERWAAGGAGIEVGRGGSG
jgi:hypothetical protein